LILSTRAAMARPTGRICPMSGKVVVTIVAPESANRVCRACRSASARSKDNPGRVTSFMPMQTVIRSGCIESACGS
jgi:hypothetical protein